MKPKPWTSMSAEERDALVHTHFGTNLVGLMKRGMWWREFGKGYTYNESEAWRLTPEKAKEYEYPYDEPTTIHQFPRPAYTTSIAAAFEVVNALQKRGLRMVMFHRENLAWECRFDNHQSGVSFEAPEAICLAALRAHNVEVE